MKENSKTFSQKHSTLQAHKPPLLGLQYDTALETKPSYTQELKQTKEIPNLKCCSKWLGTRNQRLSPDLNTSHGAALTTQYSKGTVSTAHSAPRGTWRVSSAHTTPLASPLSLFYQEAKRKNRSVAHLIDMGQLTTPKPEPWTLWWDLKPKSSDQFPACASFLRDWFSSRFPTCSLASNSF